MEPPKDQQSASPLFVFMLACWATLFVLFVVHDVLGLPFNSRSLMSTAVATAVATAVVIKVNWAYLSGFWNPIKKADISARAEISASKPRSPLSSISALVKETELLERHKEIQKMNIRFRDKMNSLAVVDDDEEGEDIEFTEDEVEEDDVPNSDDIAFLNDHPDSESEQEKDVSDEASADSSETEGDEGDWQPQPRMVPQRSSAVRASAAVSLGAKLLNVKKAASPSSSNRKPPSKPKRK
jgi:hypothetical protein